MVDYDYKLDYDKDIDKHWEKTEDHRFEIHDTYDKTITNVYKEDHAKETHKTDHKFKRENYSENNHIDLEDDSQQNIQAVSNLNSVGSAVAVQTNLASNIGVGGSILHSNVAEVVNGL